MVNQMRAAAASALATVVTMMVLACRATEPVPPFVHDPTFILLMTDRPLDRDDSSMYATLARTGLPFRSSYLSADRFEMLRAADGARFAWEEQPRSGFIGADPGRARDVANYRLPWTSSPSGLGAEAIAPGERYIIHIEAGDDDIDAATRVPDPVVPIRLASDGDSVVRWHRVTGAAGYLVALPGGSFTARGPTLQDTVLHLPPPTPFTPRPSELLIVAVDSTYAHFLDAPGAASAGISGALGVFGSFTWALVDLSP